MSYIIRNQFGAFCAACQSPLTCEEDEWDECDTCWAVTKIRRNTTMTNQPGKSQTTCSRARSYWQSGRCRTDNDRDAIRAWFSPLADDMTPYKAEILCDVETDREKKLRAFMTDKDGNHYQLTRTKGNRYSITMKRIEGVTHAA